jgi:hypothetical protein
VIAQFPDGCFIQISKYNIPEFAVLTYTIFVHTVPGCRFFPNLHFSRQKPYNQSVLLPNLSPVLISSFLPGTVIAYDL